MALTVIVPTKGRPGNAARLVSAFADTIVDDDTHLILAIDHNEELRAEYYTAIPLYPWVTLHTVEVKPQRMGPVLNEIAVHQAELADCIGFMGDDHLPRTEGWDVLLAKALDGHPGVAYGNDLVKGEALPTACVISAKIIRKLGFMCPPRQEHLYLDDYWKMLGKATGNLVYLPDVIIEHLHPTVGKAPWDAGYHQANDPQQYAWDHTAYQEFLANDWITCQSILRNSGMLA